MRLQSAYDNAAARIAKMNQDLGESIWSTSAPSAPGNENARPTQPIGATPSAPKNFSFNTSTATNNVDTTSLTTRGHALPPQVQGSARAPSPALSTSSATSSRADAAIADMSNTAPRGPLLFNPQQAKLLRSDPDWQETRQSAAKPSSRSRGPAVARSPAPVSAPRQSYMVSASATPSRAPASNGPQQWNQMQKEEPRGRVTQPTNTFASAAAPRERINEPKPAAPAPAAAPAAPLPQATARDVGNVGGEEKHAKVDSIVTSTSSSTAANPALTSRQPTSSSSTSNDKLVNAGKARMAKLYAELEAKEQAKNAKVDTSAALPAAPPAAPGPSTPATAAAPVFLPPPAVNATQSAAAEPSALDWKADITSKPAAVEKKVEPDYIPPHKRVKAASEKPAEPLKTEPKAQSKVEPKAEIMVEPKIEPKAEPKAETKAEIKAEIKTEPKLEPFAAAAKPTYTPKPTAMPTPATSPAPSSGDAAYEKRLSDFEAVAKQNPARAAMKWDELQEENTILQELITFQQEYEALAAKRVEMNAKIDSAMASKKECIGRCLNTLSIIKKMRIEEEELAKQDEARLKGLKQEE